MKTKIILAIFALATFLTALADTSYDDVAGVPVTFTVNHDGSGVFTYQWKKNGVDIPGATAKSYRIPAVAATDAGTYTCTVANKAGAILSDKGVFSVTVNPTTAAITITRQ